MNLNLSSGRTRKNTSEKTRRRSHGVKTGDSWSAGIFADGWWKLPLLAMSIKVAGTSGNENPNSTTRIPQHKTYDVCINNKVLVTSRYRSFNRCTEWLRFVFHMLDNFCKLHLLFFLGEKTNRKWKKKWSQKGRRRNSRTLVLHAWQLEIHQNPMEFDRQNNPEKNKWHCIVHLKNGFV